MTIPTVAPDPRPDKPRRTPPTGVPAGSGVWPYSHSNGSWRLAAALARILGDELVVCFRRSWPKALTKKCARPRFPRILKLNAEFGLGFDLAPSSKEYSWRTAIERMN